MRTAWYCCAGTDPSRAATAIRRAGRLVGRGRRAAVLHVWQPTERSLGPLEALRGSKGSDAPVSSPAEAEDQVALGVSIAHEAGSEAEPLALEASSSTAEMISAVADERDADVVILGARSLQGVSAAMAGSVSRKSLQTVDRPKLII